MLLKNNRVSLLRWLFLAAAVTVAAMQGIQFKEDQDEQQRTTAQHPAGTDGRQGKDLLDWIGFGTGPDTDPYLAKANGNCLNGDLAECFKSRALSSFDDFFSKERYDLTENARIVRMPGTHLRQVAQEAYEYSTSPRSDEPEWDQLVKFALRKVEKFLKSTAIEVQFPEEVTERGRYTPRFVDEIAEEIDVIEDKKETYFKRNKLKRFFIPLLIILKLFKLKLLLFLPLILGLASFKKFLGFVAIAVPGIIGLLRICKPDFYAGSLYGQHSPHYSPAGIGYFKEGGPQHQPQHHFLDNQYYYGGSNNNGGGLKFRDEEPHQLSHNHNPYSGYYPQFRSLQNGDAEAVISTSTTAKSILPDS